MNVSTIIQMTTSAVLLGLSTMSGAGTLTIEETEFYSTGSWTTTYDPVSGSNVVSLDCLALAVGTMTTSTVSKSGTIKLSLQYVGSVTDTPPSTVTLHYPADQYGRWSVGLLGRTPPSGSASGSYSGSSTKAGGSPTTISDTFGSYPQTTTYFGVSGVPKSADVSDQVLSTPLSSWSYIDNGGTRTYTLPLTTIVTTSGTATANCTVNWKGSNSASSWQYRFFINFLYV